MKNRIYIVTLFLSSLLFFIPSIVKATTYTLAIHDYNFDLINNTFLSCKTLSDNYFSSHTEYDRYLIVFRSSKYYTFFMKPDVSSSTSKFRYYTPSAQLQFTTSTTDGFICTPENEPSQQFVNYTTSTTSPFTTNISVRNNSISFYELVYYFSRNNSIPIQRFLNSDVYNFTINDELFMTIDNSNPDFPSMYDIYLALNPTPSDDYPLLTSFYNLFIEKIYLLCEYIYSDYILLSVLVVLLFYISILFFRRLK